MKSILVHDQVYHTSLSLIEAYHRNKHYLSSANILKGLIQLVGTFCIEVKLKDIFK